MSEPDQHGADAVVDDRDVKVFETAFAAYLYTFSSLGRFFRIMWLPLLVVTGYTYLSTLDQLEWVRAVQAAMAKGASIEEIKREGWVVMLQYPAVAVNGVLIVLAGASVLRHVTIDEAIPWPLGFSVDRANVKAVGYVITVIIAMFVPVVIYGLVMEIFTKGYIDKGIVIITAPPVMALSYFIALRLCFAPCAAVLGHDRGLIGTLKWSWHTVRGNTWRLIAVGIICMIPIALLFSLLGSLFLTKLLFGGDEWDVFIGTMITTAINMLMMYMAAYIFAHAYVTLVDPKVAAQESIESAP